MPFLVWGFNFTKDFICFPFKFPAICKLPFLFPELMGRALLVLFIQTGKFFQELCSVQEFFPTSHCPWAISPFPTFRVEHTPPTTPLPPPSDSVPSPSIQGWYPYPCCLGLLSQQLLELPLSVWVLFSSWFLKAFLFLALLFFPSFFWVDYVFSIIALCFYTAFLCVFSWINSICVWKWW